MIMVSGGITGVGALQRSESNQTNLVIGEHAPGLFHKLPGASPQAYCAAIEDDDFFSPGAVQCLNGEGALPSDRARYVTALNGKDLNSN